LVSDFNVVISRSGVDSIFNKLCFVSTSFNASFDYVSPCDFETIQNEGNNLYVVIFWSLWFSTHTINHEDLDIIGEDLAVFSFCLQRAL